MGPRIHRAYSRGGSRKIGIADDVVEQWENGSAQPSVAKLRDAARVYQRPLAVFFLTEPPQDFDAMHDFRRLPDALLSQWSPELHGEYRRANRQRENLLELYELEDDTPPTLWLIPIRADLDADDEAIATQARAQLLKSSPLELPRRGTQYDHLNAWTAALEAAGVLVLATSRGGVPTQEMRGFSIYHESVPIIVVNGSDAPRGRLFSLLHEYAHLIIHTSGLCDVWTELVPRNPDRRLEARCSAIAAAILMPKAAVIATLTELGADGAEMANWDYARLSEAASPFGVSTEAFVATSRHIGNARSGHLSARRDEFQAAYDEEESVRSSGGNWYRNTARDLGKHYVRTVADTLRRRTIDSYTAASYLSVKVNQIGQLAEAASLGAS